ncbi:peptide/nickel transport system substrate-binding protein [Kibdelosporangium banguiense]|uniref:Peptide/nickel transport system substrate-binding protein n=1 Tax=Kibdelosporangium banguiense TaxID=1365924 RepID=A0ABS4TR44_9PSEU|nr:ABC transporter substrate-binding protein [Kibdelosporangium banguiense]MBP2326454.1 peptide/nickel transport system substrate-binding protein [Kibdelosporangium banguiense]
MATSPTTPHSRGPLRAGAAVLAVLAVIGCSTGTQSNPGGPTQQELVASLPPAKGAVDTVTWNLTTGEPDTLFPPNAATYSGGQVAANLCDTLLTFDAGFTLKPNLATFRQADPLTLVYTIRDDAKFWDGQPVTAEDVAYSMNRAKDPSTIVSFAYQNVQDITVTGKNEVTVKFARPDVMFNGGMASIGGMVLQKAFSEKAGETLGSSGGGLMCSGPFKLDSWRSGDSITVSLNDNYWNADRRPFAKQVKFTFVTDGTALVQALNAGEIDGAYEIPPSAIPALRNSQAGKLTFGPSMQSMLLSVATPDGPLSDVKLRQSLQTLVTRDELAKAVYNGAAMPVYTVLTPATWPNDQKTAYQAAYDPFVRERAYNIEKAKKLVGESTYQGQSLVMAIQSGDEAISRTAQLIQQQAKQVGVNIEIKPLTPLVFSQAGYDANKRAGIDLILGTSFNSAPEPLEPLGFDFLPDQVYNYTNYTNETVTNLLTEARQTFDGAERAKKIIAAQQIFEPESALVPLLSLHTVTFLNNRLAGGITSFAYWSTPQMAYVGSAK